MFDRIRGLVSGGGVARKALPQVRGLRSDDRSIPQSIGDRYGTIERGEIEPEILSGVIPLKISTGALEFKERIDRVQTLFEAWFSVNRVHAARALGIPGPLPFLYDKFSRLVSALDEFDAPAIQYVLERLSDQMSLVEGEIRFAEKNVRASEIAETINSRVRNAVLLWEHKVPAWMVHFMQSEIAAVMDGVYMCAVDLEIRIWDAMDDLIDDVRTSPSNPTKVVKTRCVFNEYGFFDGVEEIA